MSPATNRLSWCFFFFGLVVAVASRADADEPIADSEDRPDPVAQVENARVEVDAITKRLRDDVADPLKRLDDKDADLAKELDAAIRRNQTQLQTVIQDERKAVQNAYLWRKEYNAELERALSSLRSERQTAEETERGAIIAFEAAWKAVERLVDVKTKCPQTVAKPSKEGQDRLDNVDQCAARIFASLDMLAKIRREEEKQRRTEGHVLAVHPGGYIDVSLGKKDGLCPDDEVALFRKSGDETAELGAARVQIVLDDHAFAHIVSTVHPGKVQPDDIVRIQAPVPKLADTEMRLETVGHVAATAPNGIVMIAPDERSSLRFGSDVWLIRGSGDAEVEIGAAVVCAVREDDVLLIITKTAERRDVRVGDRACIQIRGPARLFAHGTVLAWKEAGAEFEWMETNRSGISGFRGTSNEMADVLPACRIRRWKEGMVSNLPDPGAPFALDLGVSRITDAELNALTELKSLRSLDLVCTEVTDVGLKKLAGLENLRSLDLDSTEVTDAGLKELAGLRHLESLNLYGTEVTGAGLSELASLKNLQSLRMSGWQVTDATLNEPVNLESLQWLDLSHTRVTGEVIEELAGLKNLQSLDLSNTRVADEGLEHLAGLKGLQSLRLSFTRVTDEGLMKLAGLKGLPSLYLYKTQVTLAGVDGLQKSLPGCEIRAPWSDEDARVQRARGEVDAIVKRVRDDAVPALDRLAKKDVRLAVELGDVVSRNRSLAERAIEDEREVVSAADRWLHQQQGDLVATYCGLELEHQRLLESRRDWIERLHKTRGLLAELTGNRKPDPRTPAKPDKDLGVLLTEIEWASRDIEASLAEFVEICEYEQAQRGKSEGRVLEMGPRGLIEITLGSKHFLRDGDVVVIFRRSGDQEIATGTAFVRKVQHDRSVVEIATTIHDREIKVDDRVRTPIEYKIRDEDWARAAFVGRVVAIESDLIEITLGAKEGLTVSDEIPVFRRSGEKVVVIGSAVVRKLEDHRAVASLEEAIEEREVQVGDRVRLLLPEKKPE